MAEVTQVLVPDIGDFTGIPVIEILVAPGTAVEVDTPLVTLESDKATMEIPSPAAGTVVDIMVKIGDSVSQGSPLLTLEGAGAVSAQPEAPAQPETPAAPAAPEAPEAPQAVEVPEPAPEPVTAPKADDGRLAYASPTARRAARELGVALAGITGSGRGGRITLADVEVAAGVRTAPEPPQAPRPSSAAGGLLAGLPPWPQIDFTQFGEIERVPLTRIQRIAGPNLARNWVAIPHVTHHEEADITGLEAFRKEANAAHPGSKLTMVALLLKACIGALREFPQFNASLDGEEMILKRYFHLGFATDTPNGLVVPVIRDVDSKGLLEIADELRELSGRAREGKLGPAQMQGGTFTISSLGGIGGTAFTPIINAPEVAILGVTRSAMRPVWDGEAFNPRLMLPLSLSYDHRVIDGAAAARFMVRLAADLADMRRLLL